MKTPTGGEIPRPLQVQKSIRAPKREKKSNQDSRPVFVDLGRKGKEARRTSHSKQVVGRFDETGLPTKAGRVVR